MQERWKPAVTVAAVIERDGRYLLVEEQRPEGLMLNNPAGHLEPHESPLQGVIREALEETAHHFTPTEIVGIYLGTSLEPAPVAGGEPGASTFLRIAFCGTVGDADPALSLDEGIVRAIWMTPREIRESADRHRSPMVIRCIEDHLAGRRFPLDLIHTDPGHVDTAERAP